jgi:hypothetical protein
VTGLTLILVFAGTLLGVVLVAVLAWFIYTGYLTRVERRLQRGLLPFSRRRDVLILLAYAVLENFSYRQLTLYWRLRGLFGAWRGKTRREEFARVGFREGVARAHG